MKLTTVLLFGILFQVHADTYSQNVTLNEKNVSVDRVLKSIEKQTGYHFLYDMADLVDNNMVSISVKNASIEQTLNKVLATLPIDYKIISQTIVLKRNDAKMLTNSTISNTKSSARLLPIGGKVTDEKGEPLVAVTVSVKNADTRTVTDVDGNFKLEVVSLEDTLVFSYIGYQTQEVAIQNRALVNVQLRDNMESLNEVIVIGYGQQRQGDVTSSVATVRSEDFVKAPVVDAGQLIQGKVAGMSITAPSGNPTGSTQILLRGNSTLIGANSNPLVIIDGVPSDLKTVAPEDIETIDVLKDGSAAAIYGVRGTNGVIIVTTKRARGNNFNTVEYNGYTSTQTISRAPDMLTAADYRAQIAAGTRDSQYDLGTSTDWLKEISNELPISQVHNLTLRGGNQQTNYLVSANYRYLDGIFKKSDNATFTGRADVNHYMFDSKLKINIGLLMQNNQYTQTQDGGSFNGYTYRQAMIRNPTSPVKNDNGTWFEQPGIFNYENPVSRLYESDGLTRSQNTRFNTNLTYTPVTGLRLSALLSYTRYNQNAGYAETKQHISTIRDNLNGYAAVGTSQSIDRLMDLTAEYSKTIGSHSFTALGGYSYQDNDTFGFFQRNYDFPTDIFSYNQIGLGRAATRGLATLNSSRSQTNLIGFFGRLTYNYKDRYLLLASLRSEAASQLFGAAKPWGTFPAVSGGWRITNEPFMKNQKVFTDLKLRAGYGVTGNQPNQGFLGVGLLGYGANILSNGQWIQALVPSQNANPYLRWEEKHELNIGLDYGLFDGLVSGTIDVYDRKINGLLYNYQVPSPPNLYPTTQANVGKMENRGLEVLLNIMPVRKKDFEWTTTFTFSTNTNKLKSLSNELYQTTNNYFTTGSTGEPIQSFTNIVYVGQNIGDFYGFKVIDVTSDGQWIYEGRDGQPVEYKNEAHAFEDKKVLGNGLPKYYAGWNNTMRYKNWDFGVTMRGAFDYQIVNFQRMYYENTSLQYYNRLKSAYDPVFGKAVLNVNMPLEFNSYYVENGDFWKIDNINLGYTFPKIKSKYVKSLRIYGSSLNTFVITGYKGIDPEVNRTGLNPGVDERDKYPTTRTFTLGLNAGF